MTSSFFRRLKKRETPGCRFNSFEHQITSDLLRLFLSLHCESYHRIYVLSSSCHVDLLHKYIFSSLFGWNMLHRLMIFFRHILNYLHFIRLKMQSDMRKKERESEKCVQEKSGTIHFKMLVFIALVSWTFACGYTNASYMCLLYDDDDDQLVCSVWLSSGAINFSSFFFSDWRNSFLGSLKFMIFFIFRNHFHITRHKFYVVASLWGWN